ncbi:hypothetical protein [Nonomuraea sp. KM88]|uniref:hypothetical protein n=1 Tax=Nonomuraea sp. KM88 TaxID=3457427 RepID=UPI003FCEDC95
MRTAKVIYLTAQPAWSRSLQKCLARGGAVKVLLIDPQGAVPEEAMTTGEFGRMWEVSQVAEEADRSPRGEA